MRAFAYILVLATLAAPASQPASQATSLQSGPPPPSFELLTRRMDVDVDGAPTAYGPPNKKTLDYLKNAHYRGRPYAPIVGYLTDDEHAHRPIVQGPLDPAPGYYISQTAFTDPDRNREADPLRYVDASRVDYVVLGNEARRKGARLGDFAAVYSRRTHRAVFAIVADDGNPSGNEGSLHLLQDLGYPFRDGKEESVLHPEVIVRFYPDSNPRRLFFRTQAALDAAAQALGLSRDFSRSALAQASR